MKKINNIEEVIAHYNKCRNTTETAKEFEVSVRTVQKIVKKTRPTTNAFGGQTNDAVFEEKLRLPPEGEIYRYILTCAQNSTTVWDKLWVNLLALTQHYEAMLCISPFTYNEQAIPKEARENDVGDEESANKYVEEVRPYLHSHRIELAPGLVFCAEMNILPTAVNPISGLETYTGQRSAIFPHVKVAMQSIATMSEIQPKFNYTTGTVTMQNYVQKKAGQKAAFHHTYGALLVEVNSDGDWWARQIIADKDGTICDLDVIVKNGKVSTGNRIEAINWGDVHVGETDPVIKALNWGKDGILDTLKPHYQFMHDTESFYSQNHHDRGNPHAMYEKYIDGRDDVADELQEVTSFLGVDSYRSWCKTIVVDSNHDQALSRWLRESDYRQDPKNALIFLALQWRKYQAIANKEKDFHLLEYACEQLGLQSPVKFLRQDESFIICPDAGGGIEAGMHGHNGPNGSRGSPRGLSRMGRRANIGHTHSAGIIDGLYVAGTCTPRRLPYTRGPSSWSQSDILTYITGKRAIITKMNGKYRA
jgi:hypothetical protein